MSKGTSIEKRLSRRKRSQKVFPAIFNTVGILILVSVIILYLPIVAPRLMGYQVFNVISPSMEPAIPVGSMIIVKPVSGEAVDEGDVIAFQGGNSIVTHRVTENRMVEGEFVTKGDANAEEDMTAVSYSRLVGLVVRSIPRMGDVMAHLTTWIGRVYIFAIIACGIMFNMVASRLRASYR